jgi:hypothetical protein
MASGAYLLIRHRNHKGIGVVSWCSRVPTLFCDLLRAVVNRVGVSLSVGAGGGVEVWRSWWCEILQALQRCCSVFPWCLQCGVCVWFLQFGGACCVFGPFDASGTFRTFRTFGVGLTTVKLEIVGSCLRCTKLATWLSRMLLLDVAIGCCDWMLRLDVAVAIAMLLLRLRLRCCCRDCAVTVTIAMLL